MKENNLEKETRQPVTKINQLDSLEERFREGFQENIYDKSIFCREHQTKASFHEVLSFLVSETTRAREEERELQGKLREIAINNLITDANTAREEGYYEGEKNEFHNQSGIAYEAVKFYKKSLIAQLEGLKKNEPEECWMCFTELESKYNLAWDDIIRILKGEK